MRRLGLGFVLLSAIMFIGGCSTTKSSLRQIKPEAGLSVSKVSVDKKTFDPTKDKGVEIKFFLSKPTEEVELKLYNLNDQLIKTLRAKNLKSGFNSFFWDAKTDSGEKVKGDIVIYTMSAKNKIENNIYDPADKSEGNEMQVREFTFDSDSGEIRYVLPRACRVRLRAGLKESVLLKTIFDWQAQEAGEHKFIWDGKDESGNFALLKHPQLNLNLTAYTLPDNCMIIKNGSRNIPINTNLENRKTDRQNPENKCFHFYHNQINCHEPKFIVSFPEAQNNQDDLPILQGKVPVRVEIALEDKTYIVNKRFEAMFFVDGIFLFEEEEGSSPLTYCWDTTNLNPGEHLLSVNIMSYDDHVGTKTQKVMIGDK